MENKNVENSKVIGLRKSTVAKLITNGREIKGGTAAVQQFALLEGTDWPTFGC